MLSEDRFTAKVAAPDPATGCELWLAATNRKGYGIFRLNGKAVLAHDAAWRLAGREKPVGMLLDHTCLSHACVALGHLRLVTTKQNAEHRRGANRNSTSGFRGVTQVGARWRAQVFHNGRGLSLGFHDTPEAAAAVAQAKRRELFTHDD